MSKLVITEDGRDKVYEVVDDEFTIGRSASADCRIRDEASAPIHLKVKKTKLGFQIIDMETKSGTKVNGAQVNAHVLANGDTIEIGGVKITYIGKGPVRAGAAAGKASKSGIEQLKPGERVYRNQQTWDSKVSSGGLVAIVLGVVVIGGGIMWMALRSSTVPINHFTNNYKWTKEHMDLGTRGLADARKSFNEAKKHASTTEEKAKLRKLEEELRAHEARLEVRDETQDADKVFRQLQDTWINKPDHIERIRNLANEYLQKFDQLNLPNEAKVREILAQLDGMEVSPEKAEFGRILQAFDDLYVAREYRKAWESVQHLPPNIYGLFQEDIDKLARKAQMKSRQVLTIRKNDVRHMLREKKHAEARAAMEDIFDKVVQIAIDQYLISPDRGYDNPETAQLELDTQALMKEIRDRRAGK